MTTFADKYEEQAHGVICLLKYGSQGGMVNTRQMKQVADYLRGAPLVSAVRVVVPVSVPKPVVVHAAVPTHGIKVVLP